MRVPFKRILTSLTGISTPVFGVSWHPPTTEREVVRNLLVFMEDRRVLYNPYHLEMEHQVVDSVVKIREKLTETLGSLEEGSHISPHLRAMRAACRRFLDQAAPQPGRRGYPWNGEFFTSLGELRAVFRIHIAQLCVKHGIDIEGDLASILPAMDQEAV